MGVPSPHASPAAHRHHGARPPAAPAVADADARPQRHQWPRPPRPEPAVPAAPGTVDAVRRARHSVAVAAVVPFVGRDLGWRAQGRAEEEDVIHEEAHAVPGGQGDQGHHITEQVLGLRADKTRARAVPVLRRRHQDEHLPPAQLVDQETHRQAEQAAAPRGPRVQDEEPVDGGRPSGGEEEADPQAHWLGFQQGRREEVPIVDQGRRSFNSGGSSERRSSSQTGVGSRCTTHALY
ncbi:hypothetical protein OPT61_g6279 [Boeremia exigua]|uniref:Uncharacterized protein n=1 Tax=Boeremia exigua TaxID=749465 RepID=A0ACC2I782_9PLEO|nr:hypothetical protein OPT61_g6279 [Boeremia exigua]